MRSLLNKIFKWDFEDAYHAILNKYDEQNYLIINYIYFANIAGKKIFDTNLLSWFGKKSFENMLLAEYKTLSVNDISYNYKQALLDSDFLLPDGIALQIFYWLAAKLKRITSKVSSLANLNGTDFCLSFLDKLSQEKWKKSLQIILYWAYEKELKVSTKFLKSKWYNIVYTQNWYDNLDWDLVNKKLDDSNKYTILLIWRTTPDYPIQELWARANLKKIQQNKLLVFNQGWTFDFWAWKQKRAPKIIILLKLEWLYRLIQDPKRNWKKVLNSLKLFSYIFFYLLLKNK